MHKDPYENLFYVASGEKIFTLCPPADAPYLYEKDFLSGSFDSQPPKRKARTKRKKQAKREWAVKTGFEDGCDAEDSDDDDIRLNENHPHPSNLDMGPVRPQKSTEVAARSAYVRWIEADVAALTDPQYRQKQMQEFPLLKYAHPIHEVRVQAGELLYLPALWFHRVTQSQETVGLNYWYNMNFNSPHWCYFQLVSQLKFKVPGVVASEGRIADRQRDMTKEEKHAA
jgi:peptidyl-lysine (3S)-dioxygenase / protease